MKEEIKSGGHESEKHGHDEHGHHHHTVIITIGREEHKSPNPTTGEALYKLGNVDPQVYDLFREVHGKGDDELINNNNEVVRLKEGECFFTVQKNLNPGA